MGDRKSNIFYNNDEIIIVTGMGWRKYCNYVPRISSYKAVQKIGSQVASPKVKYNSTDRLPSRKRVSRSDYVQEDPWTLAAGWSMGPSSSSARYRRGSLVPFGADDGVRAHGYWKVRAL